MISSLCLVVVEEGDVDNLGDSVPDIMPRVEDDNAELMVETASMSCLLFLLVIAQIVRRRSKWCRIW